LNIAVGKLNYWWLMGAAYSHSDGTCICHSPAIDESILVYCKWMIMAACYLFYNNIIDESWKLYLRKNIWRKAKAKLPLIIWAHWVQMSLLRNKVGMLWSTGQLLNVNIKTQSFRSLQESILVKTQLPVLIISQNCHLGKFLGVGIDIVDIILIHFLFGLFHTLFMHLLS
jgi:hypothetical protein